ncbi:hypothetical protein [Zooshikella harenae]|uniref:Uncharacterized protein n=1 Tax=Zooshikella harenae TaxID=2827238 RepID=A0ABS5ZKI6_9GAMM|nr:hypothetical protein [Zooshikella harenae]MBU2713775.1 hypothetical protein [Zooshikella harenae]
MGNKNRVWIWIGVVIFVVIVAAIALFLYITDFIVKIAGAIIEILWLRIRALFGTPIK